MKNSALITILASAAVATAQVTLDNGTYTCSKPNVAFCAGDSLKTDIIVRCDSTGRGQPGRCSDNLAGEPPVGVQPALCYQTDPTIGDAACEKNCVVYGGSGNGNGTFTLPTDVCTPTFTATTSPTSGVITETTSTTETQCGRCESSTASVSTSEIVTESTTPASVETTTPVVPTTTPAFPTGNATVTTGAPTTSKSTTRTTATPIAPTTTSPSSVPTAGAAANAAGCFLAGLGLAVAYIL